jgi:hypothetical protein
MVYKQNKYSKIGYQKEWHYLKPNKSEWFIKKTMALFEPNKSE